jgi:hypothetical protein
MIVAPILLAFQLLSPKNGSYFYTGPKEATLKLGFHMPTLVAKGKGGVSIAHFSNFGDTHEDKAMRLFMAGIDTAHSNQVGELTEVILISEGWMNLAKRDGTKDVLPSQDPERKEVLIVTGVKLGIEPEPEMVIFEMVRDARGKLIDLEDFDLPQLGKGDHIETPLLDAFVSGFKMGASQMN